MDPLREHMAFPWLLMEDRMDKHTIYTIAERVGVSPSTVSRALSGRGYCSPKTKSKILAVAKEMNYAPDHAAKMLKMRQTNKIIFAVPDICNPFYFDMINGINQVLEEHDYLMILFYTKHRLQEEMKAIQTLRENVADGMIMVSFHFGEENIGAINARKHLSCSRINMSRRKGMTASIMCMWTRMTESSKARSI